MTTLKAASVKTANIDEYRSDASSEAPSKKREALSIAAADFFDYSYYAAQIGESRAPDALLDHYLKAEARLNLEPHPDFELNTYLKWYPDIPRDSQQAFEHYVRHGRSEKRYASRAILAEDMAALQQTTQFDHEYYASSYAESQPPEQLLQDYLLYGWRRNKRPNQHFDQHFYQTHYSDCRSFRSPPFVHYVLEMQKGMQPYCRASEAEADAKRVKESGLFDAEYYRQRHGKDIPDGCDPLLHFLTDGQHYQWDGSAKFSTKAYLRKNPDLQKIPRPILHYILHGISENRIAVPNNKLDLAQGKAVPSMEKPVILVAVHEATRTGAPILALNLVKHLSRHFNVVTWLSKSGPLDQEFCRHSLAVVKSPASAVEIYDNLIVVVRRYGISVALLNSAVCHALSDKLYELKVPVISLIHEFKDYVLPRGSLAKMVMFSQTVISPAQVVNASIDEECVEFLGWSPSHLKVCHQGHCQLPQGLVTDVSHKHNELSSRVKSALQRIPGRKVVLGAGWVHMRKGVELFVQAAQLYRELIDPDVLFVWVGGGYNPRLELVYSVWLQSQIEMGGLEDTVIFAEEVSTLKPYYDAADVFFMSSRLDPFPNVAIDASLAGLPVAVFDRTTGFADIIKRSPEIGRVIPFLNVTAAVQILAEMISERRADSASKARCSAAAGSIFDFSAYARFVGDTCREALVSHESVKKDAKALEASGKFDARFFKSGMLNGYIAQLSETTPEFIYVDLARKGIHPAKPWPGYNGAFKAAGTAPSVVSTPALLDNRRAFTHQVHHLKLTDGVAEDKADVKLNIAAHIHAFEIKGVEELVSRLGDCGSPISLFITSDSDDKFKHMQDAVASGAGNIRSISWIKVPNIGRDIGPFLCGLPEAFWQHDIIGHFHIKVSSHLDRAATEQWKSFIYDHLIGGYDAMGELFVRFQSNPKLGLLFAEDPCQIGWTKNLRIAVKLAERLDLGALPFAPEFPIGNMFWARSAALAPLRKLQFSWDELPPEPIASDGTLLHAIERLTPAVCCKAGFDWATVLRRNTLRFKR